MPAEPTPKPSFSPYRKWGIGFRVCLVLLLVLSVVVMVNYLSRDYFLRFHFSTRTRAPLSPLTIKFLGSLTNEVKVTVYYDKDDPLYSTVVDLANEYKLINPKIAPQIIDYKRDPGAAEQLQTKYSFLASPTVKNMVIFDCAGRVNTVDGNALAKYALEKAPDKEGVLRRKITAFEGEKAFTALLIAVTNPKPLKACFLEGHGEHNIDSTDENLGYLKFASVLRQNYIQAENLSLLGTNLVPVDCNLLVIAGPTRAIAPPELEKIEQYLNQGGRLLALFNCIALGKGETGLEKILAKWGVDVGTNVVKDPDNSLSGSDVIVGNFSKHPVVNPLLESKLHRLHLILPRPVRRLSPRAPAADAPRVEEVAFSGPKSVLAGDPAVGPRPFPLVVVLEKGALKGVITERGTTRMLIGGDSIFLANRQIDSAANRDFAGYAANWLLDRTQLLEGIGPRQVAEYRFLITRTQLQRAELVLLAGMPGGVLLLGGLVWFRRRR